MSQTSKHMRVSKRMTVFSFLSELLASYNMTHRTMRQTRMQKLCMI